MQGQARDEKFRYNLNDFEKGSFMYEMLKQQAEEECGHSTVMQDDGEPKWAGKLFAVVLFFAFIVILAAGIMRDHLDLQWLTNHRIDQASSIATTKDRIDHVVTVNLEISSVKVRTSETSIVTLIVRGKPVDFSVDTDFAKSVKDCKILRCKVGLSEDMDIIAIQLNGKQYAIA